VIKEDIIELITNYFVECDQYCIEDLEELEEAIQGFKDEDINYYESFSDEEKEQLLYISNELLKKLEKGMI
jgi:hypothetical protein